MTNFATNYTALINYNYYIMRKTLLTFIIILFTCFLSKAQTSNSTVKPFNHLDLGVTVGTTGIGLELGSHINDMFRVRAGFSYIPQIEVKMNFGIEGKRKDDTGNWITTKFDSMADRFKDITGLEINDNIDMVGKPNFYNGNLLIDFFPIKNNAFHVTAGFYYGSSKVAKTCNAIEDMASLLGVSMYNNMYQKIEAGEPLYGDVYLDPELEDRFKNIGEMGIHLGDNKKTGDPYMMKPDENSMVKANVFVNSFKPYLGVGYGGKIAKNNDNIRIEVDCGAMFWGGTPKIVTHDGTNLSKDINNIRGKVGDYVSFIKTLKVYPVVNLKVSFRVF